MLTKREMQAAHYARQLDLSEDGDLLNDPDVFDKETYDEGKSVLEEFTLRYSHREVVIPPTDVARRRLFGIPNEDIYLLVPAGRGTDEAWRAAIFSAR